MDFAHNRQRGYQVKGLGASDVRRSCDWRPPTFGARSKITACLIMWLPCSVIVD